ncbi:RNA polymerase sigma factor [Longimicrobium sp.]|uniref:RNA polymerase sigma factor n=1 Tax=Longimicrobium sp. TaxID=2029185 RepID=UPI002D7E29B4|nr:sigma-70 family RNA polymerase sigma factor [Longimicrobium sp.]
MPERQDDYSELLVSHLAWIDRVTAAIARRQGLSSDEADEFASWVKLKLIEDDYATLRKFRGESLITTYLTVVINRLYQDYRVSQLGRWRPSAAARRKGPVAISLERLVRRDRLTPLQAAETLRARGEPDLSDRDALKLLGELPSAERGRPRAVGDAPLATATSSERADGTLLEAEAQHERDAVWALLATAMEGLPEEDREIVKMRYWAGSTVADIARALRIEQKPLYRRLDRIHAHLRRSLEASGISKDRLPGLIDDDE